MDAIKDTISFHKDAQPSVGLKNFWPPEDGFVWSTGRWCEITFECSPRKPPGKRIVELEIELDVFKAPPELGGQNIFIYVNGLRLASRFITGRIIVLLEAPATASDNLITIDTPDATRPSDHGLEDSRRLGVQIYAIQVREV